MSITARTVVVRTDDLLCSPVDDELVILNPERNNYLGLDPIGRRIWELIATPHEVAQLCETLGQQFDAPGDQIARDVPPFLAALIDEGVVRVVSAN